jgi:hypothetical protein
MKLGCLEQYRRCLGCTTSRAGAHLKVIPTPRGASALVVAAPADTVYECGCMRLQELAHRVEVGQAVAIDPNLPEYQPLAWSAYLRPVTCGREGHARNGCSEPNAAEICSHLFFDMSNPHDLVLKWKAAPR